MPESLPVAGWCPMGCGRTLVLTPFGLIACRSFLCPNPNAVTSILEYGEHEHLVAFGGLSVFTVMHPLRERVSPAELLGCSLPEYLSDMAHEVGAKPGIYLAHHVVIEGGPLEAIANKVLGAIHGTWFLTEVERDRWPIPEPHTCSRCGDTYTGPWRNHLRDECPSTDRTEPPEPEPIEPLLDPSTRKGKR